MSGYHQQFQQNTDNKNQEQDSGQGYYHTMADRTDECYPEYPPPYTPPPAYHCPTDSPPEYKDPDAATSKLAPHIQHVPGAEGSATKTSDEKSSEAGDAKDPEDPQVEEAADTADGHRDEDNGDRDDDKKGNDDGSHGKKSTDKEQVRHPNRQHRQCCTLTGEEQVCEIYFDLIHRSAWFNEDKTCPICLGNITPNEEILTHKCQAEFHESCLTAWLAGQVPQYNMDGAVEKPRGCPNCRSEILPREWVPWFNNQIYRRGGIIRSLHQRIAEAVEEVKHRDARNEIVIDKLRRANAEKADLELDLKVERRDHWQLRKRFENLVNSLNSAYRRNLLPVNMMSGGEGESEDDYSQEEEDSEDEHYASEDD